MNFDRVFIICPYLSGSPEGAVCGAQSVLLRNLDNIHADMCMSRHFEVCRIYIDKLQELDILNTTPNGRNNPICNNSVTITSL